MSASDDLTKCTDAYAKAASWLKAAQTALGAAQKELDLATKAYQDASDMLHAQICGKK